MFVHRLLYVTLFGVFCNCTVVESKLVRRPVNTAVVQGSAVKFECVSDVNNSVLFWYRRLCVKNNIGTCTLTDIIYNGYSLGVKYSSSPRFSVTEVKNATHVTRTVNINSTQLSDAGVYLCVEYANVRQMSSAQLALFSGNTICTTNLSASGAVQENDVITMTCSITYRGNWAPVMRWFNSLTSRNFTDDVVTMTTNETTVTSQLTVKSSAGLHGSKIVCVTYFTQPSPPLLTSANNTPSYTYTWTSPTLNVQYRSSRDHITTLIVAGGICGALLIIIIIIIIVVCSKMRRKKSTNSRNTH